MAPLKKNCCPVCGYDLGYLPWDGLSPSDEICPCCGIHYGYDDAAGGDIQKRNLIYLTRRDCWIEKGLPWNSVGIQPPDNWDPIKQLNNLNS